MQLFKHFQFELTLPSLTADLEGLSRPQKFLGVFQGGGGGGGVESKREQ